MVSTLDPIEVPTTIWPAKQLKLLRQMADGPVTPSCGSRAGVERSRRMTRWLEEPPHGGAPLAAAASEGEEWYDELDFLR